jgi:hypothetical protein
MKRSLWTALVVGMALACAVGCEEIGGQLTGRRSYTFKNDSSFTVTVTPDGQDTWDGFTFGPSEDRDVTVREDDGEIHYLYEPPGSVIAEGPDGNVIRFVNR